MQSVRKRKQALTFPQRAGVGDHGGRSALRIKRKKGGLFRFIRLIRTRSWCKTSALRPVRRSLPLMNGRIRLLVAASALDGRPPPIRFGWIAER